MKLISVMKFQQELLKFLIDEVSFRRHLLNWSLLQDPEADGELEEIRREDLVEGEAEGNPGVGHSGGNQEAGVDKGEQEASVGKGEQVAGFDKLNQEVGEEAAGEGLIVIIGKSVRFAPDLPTGNGGRG